MTTPLPAPVDEERRLLETVLGNLESLQKGPAVADHDAQLLELREALGEEKLVDDIASVVEAMERTALLAAQQARHQRGTVDLANPYFGRVPPKSLDRNAFSLAPVQHLALEDGAATLTAFTAASIARAREHFPEQARLWVICGGGRRNRSLMTMIAAEVESAVVPAEAAGFDGDAVEAEAWAYLAARSLKGLPLTFPGTTGVAAPTCGGVLARGSGPR